MLYSCRRQYHTPIKVVIHDQNNIPKVATLLIKELMFMLVLTVLERMFQSEFDRQFRIDSMVGRAVRNVLVNVILNRQSNPKMHLACVFYSIHVYTKCTTYPFLGYLASSQSIMCMIFFHMRRP